MTDEILTNAIISEEETVVSSLVISIGSLADADEIFDQHCAAHCYGREVVALRIALRNPHIPFQKSKNHEW